MAARGTTDGGRMTCETCDFIGPEFDTTQAAWREMHRAFHNLGVVIGWLLDSMVAATARALARKRPMEDE